MATDVSRRRIGTAHLLLIIFGGLLLLVSLGLMGGGGWLLWADRTQRDSDGYLRTSSEVLTTTGYAVEARDLAVEVPSWMVGPDRIGKLRITVSPSKPGSDVWVGIAPRSALDSYLAGVGHDEISAWHDSGNVRYDHVAGDAPTLPPDSQSFWVASTHGTKTQTLTWEVASGTWSVVAMNTDASPGLTFTAVAAGTLPFLYWLSVGMLIGGGVLLLLALVLVLFGVRGGAQSTAQYPPVGYPTAPGAPQGWNPTPPTAPVAHFAAGPSPAAAGVAVAAAPGAPPTPVATVYPVVLEGHLDEPLSRWLWLVKWFLAIPHYIVLALLGTVAFLLTVVAFFAILFTGRYPRSIFDFNVGVMRWFWRVSFYTYSALGTDRYPPFTLEPVPSYPAHFDVVYPEHLSRGLVLVKWWLLAIPQYIIVAILAGGAGWRFGGAGVIGLLVLVAAILLLFTGRYNRQIFDVAIGLDRWVARVMVYAALMRDEYPPFRLDVGETEPSAGGTAPAAPQAPPYSPTPAPTGT